MFASLFSRTAKAGFTMIELMVVIVILVTLVSLGAIGVTQVMKGAERTKRTAFAETVRSAIMAYKNENGAYPMPSSSSGSSGVITYGSVSKSGKTENSNVEVLMELLGRDSGGQRNPEKRAYITDSSSLYICKGDRRMMKLDAALASGSISTNDMIGFRIVMNKTKLTGFSKLSRAVTLAPIRITFDVELDHYQVEVPGENTFNQVLQLN